MKQILFLIAFVSSTVCLTLLEPARAQTDSEASEDQIVEEASHSTEINVKNADLAAIVRIFSKKTKRNYILDERVKGKVSIYLPGKVSDQEAIRILDSVLTLKGFTTVPIGENLWKIVPATEAKQSTIPTYLEERQGPPTSAIVTRLLNLKYISSDDAKSLLQPLISSNGLINAYTGTNSLILIDSEDNIERINKIIEAIDVPFTDRDMTIIPIENANAVEIADKLKEILGIGEGGSQGGGDSVQTGLDLLRARMRERSRTSSSSSNNSAASNGINGSAQTASAETVSAISREPKLIADERTNSIIVVADEDTTARIRALVSQLDSEVDLSGQRFYVYRCRYANAEDLADALSGLAGGSTGSSSNASSSSLGEFGSNSSARRNTELTGRSSRTDRTANRLSTSSRSPGTSRLSNSNSSGSNSVSFGEDLSITADPSTNSLIINAQKSDYLKILELLKKLDIKRKQVLVEAMLLEVGIDDSLSMSTEFLTSTGGADGGAIASSNFSGNLAQLFSDPRSLSGFSMAAASAGTLKIPGGDTLPSQTVLLAAAQANTNVNVLSAPTILATDNEPAEIVVGQNVPFLASTSTSGDNLNNTFNQIDRQDVGITLRLTPQISAGDLVRLQIFTEVSDVIDATLASELGPTTTIRTSETSVVTKDSQMIVIGGLMSDDVSDSEGGVPFLKDVPVFGSLFRTHAESRRRTNLLIFIRPRIVRDQFDARESTLDRTRSMRSDIDYFDIPPERREVLESPDLDRVAEISSYGSENMGTILPPAESSDLRVKAANSNTQISGNSPIE
ncbi:MAG: type II secretion system secretin GspD, partial [Bdellovibrionales bacterium]|nr:type II secretion system secretin GspD [Bdellovibrionales bacterium]